MGKERGNEINFVPGQWRESGKRPDVGQAGSDPPGDKIIDLEKADMATRLSEKLGIDVKELGLNDIDLNILHTLAGSSPDDLTPSYALIDHVPESKFPDPKKRMTKANTSLRKLEFKLYFYGIKLMSTNIPGQKKYGYYLQYPGSPADTASSPSEIQVQSSLIAVATAPSSARVRTKADLAVEAMRAADNRHTGRAKSQEKTGTRPRSTTQNAPERTAEKPLAARVLKAKKSRGKITPRESGRVLVKTSPPPTTPESGGGEDNSENAIVITKQEAECLRLVDLYGKKLPELERIANRMRLKSLADLNRLYTSAKAKKAVIEKEEENRKDREFVEENYKKN